MAPPPGFKPRVPCPWGRTPGPTWLCHFCLLVQDAEQVPTEVSSSGVLGEGTLAKPAAQALAASACAAVLTLSDVLCLESHPHGGRAVSLNHQLLQG